MSLLTILAIVVFILVWAALITYESERPKEQQDEMKMALFCLLGWTWPLVLGLAIVVLPLIITVLFLRWIVRRILKCHNPS
jgi:hypothetical protein